MKELSLVGDAHIRPIKERDDEITKHMVPLESMLTERAVRRAT